jgi:DNA-binding transcriptional MerR regulator
MTVIQHFLPDEAAKLAGLSLERLMDWQKSGFLQASIRAPRRGSTRFYTFADLVALRVAVELRDAGVSLQMLRKVVSYLRQREGLSATEVLAKTNLVTDGARVYELAKGATIQIPSGQLVVQLVTLPLDEVVSEVQRKVRALRRAA